MENTINFILSNHTALSAVILISIITAIITIDKPSRGLTLTLVVTLIISSFIFGIVSYQHFLLGRL